MNGAFALYNKALEGGANWLNTHTLVSLLKACTRLKHIHQGVEIHRDISKYSWYKQNVYIGSTLIDMYAKCGLMAKAYEVFNTLATQNIVTWTSLIGGLIEHEQWEKALQYFNRMQDMGIKPDSHAFVLGIKACGNIKSMPKTQEIHAEIGRQGLLDRNPFLCSALVDTYMKCNAYVQAQDVANQIKLQSRATCNALISGFAEQGYGIEALDCFKQMMMSGISPDVVTFTSCLKACTLAGDLDMGQCIHAELERQDVLKMDLMVGNVLVDMYMKFGKVAAACELFDKLPQQSAVSWNSLIAGYVDNGYSIRALECFRAMNLAGVAPNHLTFVAVLRACCLLEDVDTGQELHAEIVMKGILQDNPAVGNSLINMYAKCGSLSAAQEVFNKLPVRDTASWTVLIEGYAEDGHGEKALEQFEKMELERISPNPVTFVCSLKACSGLGWKQQGFMLHAEIERRSLCFGDVAISIMEFYAGLGLVVHSREIFDRLTDKDEDLWTALLIGYAEHGYDGEAIELFDKMPHDGSCRNALTFTWSLKACTNLGMLIKGQDIHAEIERIGWLRKEPSVSSALIDMYIKFGLLNKAKDIFDSLPVRDVVLWTALIAGYADNDQGEEALQCLNLMRCEGIHPNDVTLLCSLRACGNTGAVNKVNDLHAEIEMKGLLETEPLVGNTLVDIYSRFGFIAEAQQVFEKLPSRTVVSWTSLMVGYAQLGLSEDVFQVFEQMLSEHVMPDPIIFVVILNTCSRSGFLDSSETYFNGMSKEFGIAPILEHQYCMLDILGRTGRLDIVQEMITRYSYSSDSLPWHTILSACRNYGSLNFAKHAFHNAMLVDNKDAASLILMSCILTEHA
ncbi:hypothetical protein KP509_14G013800 [Ceratopteris richardii]|nr:hypothetical protein KP509_14G013800 [Ceratopteris richardii]